jgi:hypothetical protein
LLTKRNATADEMLEPEEIRLAVDWLRLNPPLHPLPLETAKKLAAYADLLDLIARKEISAKEGARRADYIRAFVRRCPHCGHGL